MKWMIVLAFCVPSFAFAAGHQDAVIGCVNQMGDETNWAECRAQIFEPCAKEEVGSDSHIACLQAEKSIWFAKMDELRSKMLKRLTIDSVSTLDDIGPQWMGYVGEKCAQVGEAMAHISREAAENGCEISEVVGIVSEFQACLDGNSTQDYCVLKDE